MVAIVVHLRGRTDEPFESPVATSPEPSLPPEVAAATKPATRPAPVAPPATKPAATSPAVELVTTSPAIGPVVASTAAAPVTTSPAVELRAAKPAAPPAPVHEPIFGLPAYASEHFLIYSNASAEGVADAAARLENMYAEFRRDFADVYEPSDTRAKAFFIGNKDAFEAAGGVPGPPGAFRVIGDSVGPRLLVRHGGDNMYIEITQLVQHEGWHQFCWDHIRQRAPIWVDEGLGYYYSNAIWTGDLTIHGGINPSVYRNLSAATSNFMPVGDLVGLNDTSWQFWQRQVGFWPPYMEVWSIIYFLKHADGGQHEPLLRQYIADVAAGADTSASLGAIVALQDRWMGWLNSFKPTATHVKFFEAIAATLTGHLARAQINGQTFESIDEFLTAAKAGKLQLGPIGSDTWLPRSIMGECVRYINMFGKGYVARGDGPFEMVLEYVDGVPAARVKLGKVTLDIRATATVIDGRVVSVKIEHLSQAHPDMQ
ncbi:hypothetical protein LCGC14_0124430 [marine sediment metagenome]|uniref:DUF1570 domain-containing protein n=1 Tax=marine sediment metagenome TaxID=412755 RepID=A0A0F9Y7Q5_9ZZZZ